MSTILYCGQGDMNNPINYDVRCSCGGYLGALGQFRENAEGWRSIECRAVLKDETTGRETLKKKELDDGSLIIDVPDETKKIHCGKVTFIHGTEIKHVADELSAAPFAQP